MYVRPYPDELYHYGVKGMKWGVRKPEETSGTPRTAWGRRRQTTNQHNAEIKKRYQSAKDAVASGKLSKSSTEYKQARNARVKNLAGRAVVSTVAGKSAQGRYYQYRQNGETKAKALIKTVGHNAVSSAAVRASAAVGIAAIGLVSAGMASTLPKSSPIRRIIEKSYGRFY